MKKIERKNVKRSQALLLDFVWSDLLKSQEKKLVKEDVAESSQSSSASSAKC